MDCCKGYEEKIFDYVEGLLPSPTKKAIENHIKSCQKCSEVIEVAKSLTHHLKGLNKIRTSEEFETVLRTRIGLERSFHRGGVLSRPVRIPLYAAAGALAMAAFFVFAVWNGNFRSGNSEPPIPASRTFTTPGVTPSANRGLTPNRVNFPVDWVNVTQNRTYINSDQMNRAAIPGADSVRAGNARQVQGSFEF